MSAPLHVPKLSGGLDAYELCVFVMLGFRCDDCGVWLDCPVTERDTDAPGGAWMQYHARRALAAGWYVYPTGAGGGLATLCFCPACTTRRALVVSPFPTHHPAA